MSLIMQISLGTTILIACSILHFAVMFGAVKGLKKISNGFAGGHWLMLIAVAFAAVVFSHTAQIWIWAAVFVGIAVLPDISDALYFSIVTYTTVGYGDMTVSEGYRVFAVMGAVTGMLNFGLSTAFLVGLFARLLPDTKSK